MRVEGAEWGCGKRSKVVGLKSCLDASGGSSRKFHAILASSCRCVSLLPFVLAARRQLTSNAALEIGVKKCSGI